MSLIPEKYKPYVRPVLITAGIGTGIFLAYKLFTKGSMTARQIKERSEFGKEQKGKLSFPKTQYKSWADSLEKAWYEYPFGIGTDEQAVYSIFSKLKNNNDWLELQKAYGVRTYYDGGFAAGNYNLVEALNVEDQQSEMRDRINKMFKSKGITYRL